MATYKRHPSSSSDATLIYAPDIKCYVRKYVDGRILDLSDDIEDFTLDRVTNAVSRFDCTLNNQYHKYTSSESTRVDVMDSIVVFLRRLEYLQVFTGYVTYAPLETAIPGSVTLRAGCTIKRLEHTYWDPYTPQGLSFLPNSGVRQKLWYNPITGEYEEIADGGIRAVDYEDAGAAKSAFRILTQVAGYDEGQILIQKIPREFVDRIATLRAGTEYREDRSDTAEIIAALLSTYGYGADATASGPGGVIPQEYAGELQYPLSTSSPRVRVFTGQATGRMAISGESRTNPNDPWYCAMDWPSESFSQWRNYHLYVTNQGISTGVVLRPAEMIPGVERTLWVTEEAYNKLGLNTPNPDSKVNVKVIEKSAAPAGPIQVTTVTQPSTTANGTSNNTPITNNPVSGTSNPTAGITTAAEFLRYALAQAGDRYVTAAGRDTADTDPDAFDCSGLVYWAAVQCGYPASWPGFGQWALSETQYLICKQEGTLLSVEDAKKTAGALLFRSGGNWNRVGNTSGRNTGHVAISLGNGSIIHAASPSLGVRVGSVGDSYEFGGWLKGMTFTGPITGLPQSAGSGGDPRGTGSTTGGGFRGSTEGVVTPLGTYAGSNTPQGGTYDLSPFALQMQYPSVSLASVALDGRRAFINDEQVIKTIGTLMQSSLREFQSAPDGKFIAWYPDYFGFYGKTPAMTIRDIELVNLDIYNTDESIATHVAVAGQSLSPGGSPTELDRWLATQGIVSVENTQLFKMLAGYSPSSRVEMDAKALLDRFGMRPLTKMTSLVQDPLWEWMQALFLFMKAWATWTQTHFTVTFMPELYPGMRIIFPDHDNLEMYVESVSHRGSAQSGYSTTVNAVAPVRNGKLILDGIPRKVNRGNSMAPRAV